MEADYVKKLEKERKKNLRDDRKALQKAKRKHHKRDALGEDTAKTAAAIEAARARADEKDAQRRAAEAAREARKKKRAEDLAVRKEARERKLAEHSQRLRDREQGRMRRRAEQIAAGLAYEALLAEQAAAREAAAAAWERRSRKAHVGWERAPSLAIGGGGVGGVTAAVPTPEQQILVGTSTGELLLLEIPGLKARLAERETMGRAEAGEKAFADFRRAGCVRVGDAAKEKEAKEKERREQRQAAAATAAAVDSSVNGGSCGEWGGGSSSSSSVAATMEGDGAAAEREAAAKALRGRAGFAAAAARRTVHCIVVAESWGLIIVGTRGGVEVHNRSLLMARLAASAPRGKTPLPPPPMASLVATLNRSEGAVSVVVAEQASLLLVATADRRLLVYSWAGARAAAAEHSSQHSSQHSAHVAGARAAAAGAAAAAGDDSKRREAGSQGGFVLYREHRGWVGAPHEVPKAGKMWAARDLLIAGLPDGYGLINPHTGGVLMPPPLRTRRFELTAGGAVRVAQAPLCCVLPGRMERVMVPREAAPSSDEEEEVGLDEPPPPPEEEEEAEAAVAAVAVVAGDGGGDGSRKSSVATTRSRKSSVVSFAGREAAGEVVAAAEGGATTAAAAAAGKPRYDDDGGGGEGSSGDSGEESFFAPSNRQKKTAAAAKALAAAAAAPAAAVDAGDDTVDGDLVGEGRGRELAAELAALDDLEEDLELVQETICVVGDRGVFIGLDGQPARGERAIEWPAGASVKALAYSAPYIVAALGAPLQMLLVHHVRSLGVLQQLPMGAALPGSLMPSFDGRLLFTTQASGMGVLRRLLPPEGSADDAMPRPWRCRDTMLVDRKRDRVTGEFLLELPEGVPLPPGDRAGGGEGEGEGDGGALAAAASAAAAAALHGGGSRAGGAKKAHVAPRTWMTTAPPKKQWLEPPPVGDKTIDALLREVEAHAAAGRAVLGGGSRKNVVYVLGVVCQDDVAKAREMLGLPKPKKKAEDATVAGSHYRDLDDTAELDAVAGRDRRGLLHDKHKKLKARWARNGET